jgi:putative acetyltransferase
MNDARALGYGMRPMLQSDLAALADIFQESIEGLTGDDYSAEQQAAWTSAIDDEAAFAARLADELVLVAIFQGAPVAFAALKANGEIDFLYVHPAHARRGVATMLANAVERLSRGRGAKVLTVQASDTARAFFDGLGYRAEQRNTVFQEGQWLSNTTMSKKLGEGAGLESGDGSDKGPDLIRHH